MISHETYQAFLNTFFRSEERHALRVGQAFLNQFSYDPEVDKHRVGNFLWEEKSAVMLTEKLYQLKLIG